MSDTPARRYREITISAIVFGVVVGAIMNAAITYSGLKIGFTIVGSAIAAVLGFGILRGVLRKGSILETNIGQTIASSVNTTNSGVIFTVPVLLLLGYSLDPTEPRFWLVTLACMAGAVMGAAFILPLRKQMIDIERLRFPSGTAVGAILKSPGAGVTKTLLLLAGIVVAMAVYLPTVLPDLPGGSLRGYSVLDVRMARVVDEEATAAARAADPEAPEVLVERVD
ncbi:MAG: OPT/YSL family transporter, partial [Phycisphaerales bacterium JB039]